MCGRYSVGILSQIYGMCTNSGNINVVGHRLNRDRLLTGMFDGRVWEWKGGAIVGEDTAMSGELCI